MSTGGNKSELEKELNQISDQLCFTLEGDTDLRIRTDSDNTSLQKLSMLINFVLDTSRRNLAFSDKLLNTVAEGIYGIDRHGNTTFANNMACKVLGYASDELMNQPMHNIIHHTHANGEHYNISDCPIHRAMNERKTFHIDNEVFWHKNGNALPVRYIASPIFENEQVTGVVVTFTDISIEQRIKSHLDTIATIQQRFIHGAQRKEIYELILTTVLEYSDSEYGFIGSVQHDGNGQPYLKTYAITNIAWDKQSRELYQQNIDQGLEFRNLDTLFGYVLKTEQMI